MGYVSRDIAIIDEPKRLSLSGLPNFVQFSSKPALKTYIELNLQVNAVPATPVARTVLNIVNSTGELRSFRGTVVPTEVGQGVYFISANSADTAENLMQALTDDAWLRANFEIVIPFNWSGSTPTNGSTLNIKSKGAGSDYQITVSTPNDVANSAYTLTIVNGTTSNNDSISGEASTAEIELDVYINPEVRLGQDDRPITPALIGQQLTTLSKTYAGAPLWFELNALFAQYPRHSVPRADAGWFDTGTLSTYRFVAKVKALNSFAFYQSNALFVLTGYGKATDELDLDAYVLKDANVKLLTDKPRTPYVRGQREYLTFIYEHTSPDTFLIGIQYRAYSTAGDFLGQVGGQGRISTNLPTVNTCVLDIDAVLDQFPNAGLIRVYLVRNSVVVSNALEYLIRPDCLHTLQQFIFLNRLGGWDTFNFDAPIIDEIKPTVTTYNKTLTPNQPVGASIETVYSTSLANPHSVEGAPVSDDVAEWLKELAASRVIYDNEGNYIIVEDFELKPDPRNKNFHIPKMKYRLSQTYTND